MLLAVPTLLSWFRLNLVQDHKDDPPSQTQNRPPRRPRPPRRRVILPPAMQKLPEQDYQDYGNLPHHQDYQDDEGNN